jgi:hypothetical protein
MPTLPSACHSVHLPPACRPSCSYACRSFFHPPAWPPTLPSVRMCFRHPPGLPPALLSVRLSVVTCLGLPALPHVCLSVRPPMHLFVCECGCLVYLASVCLSICLSVLPWSRRRHRRHTDHLRHAHRPLPRPQKAGKEQLPVLGVHGEPCPVASRLCSRQHWRDEVYHRQCEHLWRVSVMSTAHAR